MKKNGNTKSSNKKPSKLEISPTLLLNGNRSGGGTVVDVESEPCSDSLVSMHKQRPPYSQQISNEDWERTPASVRQLVEDMAQRLNQLEQQLTELQAQNQLLLEQINRTSSNSSQSP